MQAASCILCKEAGLGEDADSEASAAILMDLVSIIHGCLWASYITPLYACLCMYKAEIINSGFLVGCCVGQINT